MNKVVEIVNLSFSYDNKKILNNINLYLSEGDFVALIGRNGAGKTTLLKLILGELKTKEGNLRLFGETSKNYKKISYIGQNISSTYKNFPTSVEEVVKIHLRFLKKKVDIKKYLNLVGLYEHRKKTLGSLSGGQLQRLSLLIALIKDSKLILLDEPTASIDKKFSDEFLKILKDLARQGKTILMVTHDVFNINTYVNKVYELRDKEVYPYKGELIYG
ncbi:metal ABC transporter ATP-binding protein [Peptoniphilus lacrimalis]|uniref:ABC transporter, ATP-binding protein n=1 Tax=Peptoniphilus lacrimalis 315-B TaxID=596330 RepID=D1VRR5_9FIRM|nr:ATP-binding cassette domain-containing protein [Peptoniphilus lacrimalis]EFA90774.1 ABC transporter, ATP-binding protein [Peptoniphilus lacrimalis 315-B]